MNFPGNIEEMLTNMYGDFMQLPPVEKRKTHTPSRLEFSKEEIL
jgi:lipopolysaccharide cholinephosphotransferase